MQDFYIYILIIAIPLLAQLYITINYKKYLKNDNSQNLSGFEVARKILDANNLQDIDIVSTPGSLTDHYDPSRKVVRLSQEVFNGNSQSAMAIAAHECGHAVQDKEGYFMMRLRSFIVPIVNLGTKLSYIVIMIALIAELTNLLYIGIALVSLGLIFQLITLPVEIDASKRAKKNLETLMIADNSDIKGVKKVLIAAALTYVAGVLTALLDLLRLILVFSRRD